MKYLKYFLMPILTLPLIVGIFLGGNWMWLGLSLLFLIVIVGDAVLGDDTSNPQYNYPWLLEVPLHLALPLIGIVMMSLMWSSGSKYFDFLGLGQRLSHIFSYDFLSARNQNMWIDYLGAVLGTGFIVAGYGTNVAHELTHRIKNKISMIEGRWLLSISCNADFAIEHVYGHHVTVGTRKDPATAPRGMNVYVFAIRSTLLGHLSAWKLELKRLKKNGYSSFSYHNRMISGYFMSIVWMGLFYQVGGLLGFILFFGQAIFAKFILEIANYMEHYGLMRDDGQSVGPEHSWNTNRKMSSIVLFTLTRHSAHHEKPKVPFWKLDPYVHAPQMPSGYLSTLLICLIPSLWYKTIGPELEKWDQNYGAS